MVTELATGIPKTCDFVEGTHTEVSLDNVNGDFIFRSTDPRNTAYPPGDYKFEFTASSGASNVNRRSFNLDWLQFNCMIFKENWVWPPGNEFQEIEINREDYKGNLWSSGQTRNILEGFSVPNHDLTSTTCLTNGFLMSNQIESIDKFDQVYG